MSSNAETPSTAPKETQIVVHHLNDSRSQRILWLLEELNVSYTIKKYQRKHNMMAPEELLAINPLGKSPVITDGDVTLAESGAIVQYLIDKYGKGRCDPPATGQNDNLYFTHYAEGSLMPSLITKLVFDSVLPQTPFLVRPIARLICDGVSRSYIQPEINKHLGLIEAHFKKVGNTNSIVGGENLTSADYMMMFPLEGMMHETPDALCSEAIAYVKRSQARPAYKRLSIILLTIA